MVIGNCPNIFRQNFVGLNFLVDNFCLKVRTKILITSIADTANQYHKIRKHKLKW